MLSGAQALVGEQKVVISDSGNARKELKQGHMTMHRGTMWATAHGVTRVRYDFATKPRPL